MSDQNPPEPNDEPTPETHGAEGLIHAEIERLSALLAEEEAAEDELAQLEIAYSSVHQAVADVASKLAGAQADLTRLKSELDDAETEQEREHARIDAAREEDIEWLDAALADLMRLSQGRYVAELEVAAARAEVEALEEECAGQQALVVELEGRVAEAKERRQALEQERAEVEKAAGHEANRLRVAKARLSRLSNERRQLSEAQGALAEAASVIDAAGLAAAAEGETITGGVAEPEPGRVVIPRQADRETGDIREEKVLVRVGGATAEQAAEALAPAADAAVPSSSLAEKIHLPQLSKINWSANASWNAAFAILSVMVVLLGIKTLTGDPSATEAFCKSAPQLDVVAARAQLADLAKGAQPGDAYSTFEQGRYAYTTTSQVEPEVREAALALESAHAAVAEQKGQKAMPKQLQTLGQAVVDADANLREACQTYV